MRAAPALAVTLTLASGFAPADETASLADVSLGGHFKYRFVATHFPDDSVYRELSGPQAHDHAAELRLNFRLDGDHWDFRADYQFVTLHADTLEISRSGPTRPFPGGGIPDDRQRWWDLTH